MTDHPAGEGLLGDNEVCGETVTPFIVCAADDNYAKCLAAMSSSLVLNARENSEISLYVLDGGISAKNRCLLEKGWKNKPIVVHWITPDIAELVGLETSQHINHTTYFRILLGSVLPADISRVIYLDVDMIIERDICELWEQSFNGAVCLAVQDSGAPYIDSQLTLGNFQRCRGFLASECPIPNYKSLGLDAVEPYLNGGVMYIDLDAWRDRDMQSRMLSCLENNQDHVLFWDQYALNVVLHKHWRRLGMRWNQTPGIFAYPNWQSSPFDEETFAQARSEPYIRHFASAIKPWQCGYRGSGRKDFYKYLDLTGWSGWRPSLNLREIKKNMVFGLKHVRARFKHLWVT